MEVQNLSLTINGEAPSAPIEIILREGKASEIINPVKTVAECVLSGPWEFVRKRGAANMPNGLVEYSYSQQRLTFYEDSTNPKAAVITGQLTLNPDLMGFYVNQDRYFTAKEFRKLILSKAYVFADMEKAKEFKKSLETFTYNFETQVQKEDTRDGNTKESVKKALKFTKGQLPEEIDLRLPLFIGEGEQEISLSIEIEVQGTQPTFGFFSLNLDELIRNESEVLINDQIKHFDEYYPCLEQ